MKIAIFALLMVVVLTLVQTRTEIDAVDELRSKRDLINKLVQRNLGNGRRRQTRYINQKHQSVEDTIKQVIHMSKREAQTEDAGK
jgi:hypothetical protein